MYKKPGVENRGLEKDYFDTLCTYFNDVPCLHTIGINLVYLGQGSAGLRMTAHPELSGFKGRLHGGIYAALADTAMWWASATLGHAGLTNVTLDMGITYFAAVIEESELVAEGQVINATKRTAAAEANLFNKDRKLIAKSRGTFMIDSKAKLT